MKARAATKKSEKTALEQLLFSVPVKNSLGFVYNVQRTNLRWRCNCAEYSAKSGLSGNKNYQCKHIKKVMKDAFLKLIGAN